MPEEIAMQLRLTLPQPDLFANSYTTVSNTLDEIQHLSLQAVLETGVFYRQHTAPQFPSSAN